MTQRHALDRVRHAGGLGHVELVRPAMRDRAVGARARADVTEDHEGRGAMMPALADVGTARLLADGMKLQLLHHALEPEIVLRSWRADFQPGGLWLAWADELERRLNHLFLV